MRTRLQRHGLALVLALACSAAAPAAAPAADYMLSVMQDDNQLVYGTGSARENALTYMERLGVDAIRVTVLWDAVAPRRRIRNGKDPAAYPAAVWDRYDELVKSARRRGIAVYFNVTAPGPPWAHARSRDRANRRTWKPKAAEFGKFMRALGKRYSGAYPDENGDRAHLPRVSWWGIFNEPNQGGWLTPQAQRSSVGVIPTSPILYRELLAAGASALVSSGHGDDLVLIGETAPLGEAPESDRRPLRPALFLRELFCLDRRLRPYRGRQAVARSCDRVSRLAILSRLPRLAYGHHPYTKNLPPNRRDRHRDSLTMANLKKLPALLDRIAARTGLFSPGIGILLTEFGYETNPPDPFNGIGEAEQAAYINVADYMAYRSPRVFATTQFQLFDVPPQDQFPRDSRQYWFTYQSGLFGHDGRPKPAADAYVMPFEARRAGGANTLFWGQVRFTPNGAPQTIHLQMKPTGSGEWQTVGAPVPVTNHVGFWQAFRDAPAGSTWRAVWSTPDFSEFKASREIRLG